MSKRNANTWANHSEGNHHLPGVEIFAAGEWRGKRYTTRDLDDMVRNFARSSRLDQKPKLRVPAVLGHEEEQELLHRSDIPAAGWCSRVWREGAKLKADFEDVPDKVARLLRGKAYRTVSAEVYDEPPEGVTGRGKMLRRVAFLGGDIPQLKCLDDIPMPLAHSEWAGRHGPQVLRCSRVVKMRDAEDCYAVFHEVTHTGDPMDRQALIEQLASHGMDTSLITDAIPDPALAEMVRLLDGSAEQDATEHEEGEGMVPEDDVEEFGDEEEDADQYDDDLLGGEEDADEYCDDQKPSKGQGVSMAKMAKMSELINRAVAKALAASDRRSKSERQALKKLTRRELGERKRATVDAFCETKLKEGKILPSELDADNPHNLKRRLLRADCVTPVVKHSEPGKGKGKAKLLTELDLQMREIDRRPAVKFAERFKDPIKGKDSEDSETAKLEEHFDCYSEQFGKVGMTKDKLLAGYKAERKRKGSLTAEEYLRK